MQQPIRFTALGGIAGVFVVATCASEKLPRNPQIVNIERKTCQAPDGVTIVYSAAGSGEIALVFIHGGLADRSFFDGQLKAFADRYRVIALDLAGHGESSTKRTKWGIPEFGADVDAVVSTERLKRVILFGNSLGGPAAIEAALLLGDRAIGVVGIDTFHNFDHWYTPDQARQQAEAFQANYNGSLKKMVLVLFHPDVPPTLLADVEERMQKTSPETASAVFLSLSEYKPATVVRQLEIPLRSINGDIFPTDAEGVRKIKPDFDVVVMKHIGHYPMLERPDEFNRHVAEVVHDLSRSMSGP